MVDSIKIDLLSDGKFKIIIVAELLRKSRKLVLDNVGRSISSGGTIIW